MSQRFRDRLADCLESNHRRSLKHLVSKCFDYLDDHDRLRILCNVSPSLSFFEHLARSKPQIRLADIKQSVEHGMHNDKAIFHYIERAIKRREVAFDLEYTLLQLKANKQYWAYVLDHIAIEMVNEEPRGCPMWKDVADYFGYPSDTIHMLETRSVSDERPTFKLLRILYKRQPELDIKLYLVEKLTLIGRLDIVNICCLP